MLEYTPGIRISAKDALNDKWIQGLAKRAKEPIRESFNNISNFKIQCILQRIVMTFIANRLQTQEEQRKLSQEFNAIDTNGDGLLQREELVEAYIKLGKTHMEANTMVMEILEKIDSNDNGNVDFSEFLTANLKKHEAIEDMQLMEAFKLFDKVHLK